MTDRPTAGRVVYARNFRVDHAEAERTLTERVGADFAQEVFEAAGGLGWQSTVPAALPPAIPTWKRATQAEVDRNRGARGLANQVYGLTKRVAAPPRRGCVGA
jgi:hypothetical protein